MDLIERGLIRLITRFAEPELINAFFGNPRNTAIIIGIMIAVSGGILGTFLLLRGMSLTSDAISHTVLLGIVVAFMIIGAAGGNPSLSSPWLLIGAALAGVGTVVLTEVFHRSGLVKQDAALGLAFPLLFALAVLFISRYVDDVHLDEDAVMIGEIGVAWADTNSHGEAGAEGITITPDDPRAQIIRQCANCRSEGISPRDEGAVFADICVNCGEYTPAAAYRAGLTDFEPRLVFWPKSVTMTGVMMLLTLIFVSLFYKELKLATFDPALSKTLGFRPTLLLYILMTLVSLVAVGAFNAVGSILVVAFFVIPPAAAYLLTDRLPVMLILGGALGGASSWLGYDLARGRIFGLNLNMLLSGGWDTSISASMVVMMLLFFLLAFLVSPRYGIISAALRRARERRRFEEQVLMAHVYHHTDSSDASEELAYTEIPYHIRWEPARLDRVLKRASNRSLIFVNDQDLLGLTARGRREVESFREETFPSTERVGV